MTTSRWAVAYASALTGPASPAGVNGRDFAIANLEDVHDLLHGLELVQAAVACDPQMVDAVTPLTWPGTPVVPAVDLLDTCVLLADLGADEAVIVAADAPDFPALLVGKLFRALGRADIAVSPCQQGGLVAVGVKLDRAEWIKEVQLSLDDADVVQRLSTAAPSPRAFALTPGWHRLRDRADLVLLDAGLEGWDTTRMLLEGAPR